MYMFLSILFEIYKTFTPIAYILTRKKAPHEQKKKNTRKKPISEKKKKTISAEKKALFDITIDLKRVFCRPLYTKYSFSTCLKQLIIYFKYLLWYLKHFQFYKLVNTFSFTQILKKWFLAFTRTN